ncbi:MAG: hypothetical protein ACPHL4_01965, partial [Acidimicrobiales bacterium]
GTNVALAVDVVTYSFAMLLLMTLPEGGPYPREKEKYEKKSGFADIAQGLKKKNRGQTALFNVFNRRTISGLQFALSSRPETSAAANYGRLHRRNSGGNVRRLSDRRVRV